MMGYIPMPRDKAKHFGASADEQRKEDRYLVSWKEIDTKRQSYYYTVLKTTIKMKDKAKRNA